MIQHPYVDQHAGTATRPRTVLAPREARTYPVCSELSLMALRSLPVTLRTVINGSQEPSRTLRTVINGSQEPLRSPYMPPGYLGSLYSLPYMLPWYR